MFEFLLAKKKKEKSILGVNAPGLVWIRQAWCEYLFCFYSDMNKTKSAFHLVANKSNKPLFLHIFC